MARLLASPRHAVTRALVRGLSPSLPADLAAQLGPAGDQALLRIDLAGADARRPILSRIAAITGQAPRLLHGGLNDVQGEPYGRLFLALGTAEPGRIARVLADLAPISVDLEVLGHVPNAV